jgi:type I restriction enzyme R subunit
MSKETDARIIIDRLLREAGWDIENKSQVSTEEAAADGRADYLLKDTRTRPLAIVEAKRFTVDPYSAKDQARDYAQSLPVHFILLSNGEDHYFWDYTEGDARSILGFPSPSDLERRAGLKIHRRGDLRQSLASVPYPERFRFKGEEIEIRPYQKKCVQALDNALLSGRRRMLIEMATGTGKTLTIAMIMKRWFQGAVISRVLFLADRIELAKQAKETFDDYLSQWPSTLLYGGRRSLEGQIVVGTLDTIAGQLGPGGFGHAYFDLVVTDECHRSIYSTHRATLAHFDAIQIGLTATPNPGELRWVSETERQLVRSTYVFFDCWDSAKQEGNPTFTYSIQQGINDGYLADYKIYVAESRLTFEGATWEGDEIKPGQWERTVTSWDRNKLLVDEFYRVEEERGDPRTRKTIVFAASERHATQLEQLFNRALSDELVLRLASHLQVSPGAVRSDYAKKITCYSNNSNPKPFIDRFKYDALPVLAISVDMLDTGYDHKEVENLVMMRPTKSAIKYAQMRGRGSRLCPRIGKSSFLIYDFVGNTGRFDDPGQEYHRPREVGRRSPAEQAREPETEYIVTPEHTSETLRPREFVEIPLGSLEDEFRRREMIAIGPEGLAIDRKTYLDKWHEKVTELKEVDPAVRAVVEGRPLREEEWDDLAARLNCPEFWFTEQSLQAAFDQPAGSLADFILAALGLYRFPTREERIERSFAAWVAQHNPTPHQSEMLRLPKARVLAGDHIDMAVFNQPPFSLRGGRARMEQLFGRDRLHRIVEEANIHLVA